ncbi:hypothetical protein Trydic_g8973 [Trypoxylus dichotomus]
MNAMLHKRCAKFIYVVPEGLRELMSDISREVIRSQPKYIYTFIADYLDALMITRENARVAARLVDSIIKIGTTTVELLEKMGMTRQEADRMASIIQSAFKQYMAARRASLPPAQDSDVDEEGEEEEPEIVSTIMEQYGDYIENEVAAAEIIQNAFRNFKARHDQEKQLLCGMIDWRVAARSAIYLYRKTGVTYEEANRAATMIKAAYKGYYTRRIMKRLLEEGKMLYGDDYEKVEPETVEYEETYDEPSGLEWKEYLDLTHQEQVAPEYEEEDSSTEAADSVIDDMLSSLRSGSVVDDEQEMTPPTWTEGVGEEMSIDEMRATTEYLMLEGQGEDFGEATEIALEQGILEVDPTGAVEAEPTEPDLNQEDKSVPASPSAPDETATEYTATGTESSVTTEATERGDSNV